MRYASLRQGLVGAWCPSLASSGNTLIDLANRTNVDLSGKGASWNTIGGRLALSQTTAVYISKTLNMAGSSYGTISAWSYAGGNFGFNNVSNTGNKRFYLEINTSGTCYLCAENGVLSFPNFTYTKNKWAHYVFWYDGNQAGTGNARVRAYVNGVQQTLTTGGSQPSATLSASIDPLIFNFSAGCDDVRIYNRALSESEIRLLASYPGIGLKPERQRNRYSAPITTNTRNRSSRFLGFPA